MEQYKEKQEKDIHSEQLDFSPSTGSLNIKQDVVDIQSIIGRENMSKVTKISLSGSLRNLHNIHFSGFQNLGSVEANYGVGNSMPTNLQFDCRLLNECKKLKYVLISGNSLDNVESLPLIGGTGWQVQRQFIIDRLKTRSEWKRAREEIIPVPTRRVAEKADSVDTSSPEVLQEKIQLSSSSSLEMTPITEKEQTLIRGSGPADVTELMLRKTREGLQKIAETGHTLQLGRVGIPAILAENFTIAYTPYILYIIPKKGDDGLKPLGIKLTDKAVQDKKKITVAKQDSKTFKIYVGTEVISVGDALYYEDSTKNPNNFAEKGESLNGVFEDTKGGTIYTYYKSIRNENGQSSQQLRGSDENGKTLFFLQIKGTVGMSGIKNISAQSNGDIDLYYRSSNDVGIKILRDSQTGELRSFQLLQKGLIDEDVLDILDQNGKKIPCINGKK